MLIRELDKPMIDEVLHGLWKMSNDIRTSHQKSVNISKRAHTTTFEQFATGSDRDKIDIIGGLPFLLLNKNYFKDRESVTLFAERYLNIPSKKLLGRKRSTRELLGIIVAEVYTMESKRLSEFRNALTHVLDRVEKGEVRDFFTEWDEAIKTLRARR